MSSRKTLKSVSVEGLKPTVTLTPVIEPCGEGYRIHLIKSDSIASDGRDTFVPLRHVSKQKRRIFELEDENAKLREELAKWERLADGIDLPEYPVTQFKPKDLERENAKLRELASILCFCMQVHKLCDDCKLNGAKGDMAHDPLLACKGLHAMLRELEIEVP